MTDIYKEKLDHACAYFKHPYVHSAPGHAHVCLNEDNVTLRCGYDPDDWMTCPISDSRENTKLYQFRDEKDVSRKVA